MIQKIFPTKTDAVSLSTKNRDGSVAASQFDYKNIIVNKPWGYEYLMFENKHVAIWILFLKQGAKTSMHCHPKKKTSLLVLEGEVKTSSLEAEYLLKTLGGVIIDKETFHSTSTDFAPGSFVMEIETPPEKGDLVRLNDEYGRENKGYEGAGNMSKNLEEYEHHSFHDKSIEKERKIIEKVIKKSRVVLHQEEDWGRFYQEIKTKKEFVISFLDTSLHNKSGEIVVGVGEVCDGSWFLEEYQELLPGMETFTALTVY